MKEVVKKAMLWGFVGVPVFIISVGISNGIITGVKNAIKEHKNNK